MLNKYNLNEFVHASLVYDLSMLMEMQWQTIAGEKFDHLVLHEIPLFELMLKSWNQIPVIRNI
jgi:hypothetical protein